MTPLKTYRKKRVVLQLPGDLTVFTVDWLSLYDVKDDKTLGSIIIPEELNVPPSLVTVVVSTVNTYMHAQYYQNGVRGNIYFSANILCVMEYRERV